MDIEIFKIARLYKFKLYKYAAHLNEEDFVFANASITSIKNSIDKLKYEIDTFLNEVVSDPEYAQSHLEDWSFNFREAIYFCLNSFSTLPSNLKLDEFLISIGNRLEEFDSQIQKGNLFEGMSIDKVIQRLEKASQLISELNSYLPKVKSAVQQLANDEKYYGESLEEFQNVLIPFMEKLEKISDLFDHSFNFDYDLFRRECQEKIQSDLAYQEYLKEQAIDLMDPEDREDPEMLQRMREGKYF